MRCISPEQSKPSGVVPPHVYGAPRKRLPKEIHEEGERRGRFSSSGIEDEDEATETSGRATNPSRPSGKETRTHEYGSPSFSLPSRKSEKTILAPTGAVRSGRD